MRLYDAKHANVGVRALCLVLALVLTMALVPVSSRAQSYEGKDGWHVTYTAGGQMSDNYSQQEYVDQISQLQPGDDITLSVKLIHENATPADWYISNTVISSLEDSKKGAEGSAYEYVLSYAGPTQSRELYNSQAVGGTGTEGLVETNKALEDFTYLETLSQGQTAAVTLKITLDGETEGNAYFETLAKLKMAFAVEPVVNQTPNTVTRVNRRVVQTGDQERLFPFYVAMVVSGALFVGFAVQGIRQRRAEREEATR
ncbi:MAG: hypothetical protein IKE22_07825 [Atopobiaceae bacterium]|nr:hypothetical protein [Atopobiaceae bacterium]